MTPVKIGILGLGTVGCGTIDVLRRNADEISRRAGRSIEVVQACVQDLHKKRPVNLDGIEIVSDLYQVIANESIDIIVELIGGTDVAFQAAQATLNSGKHLVTANKAVIALHGNDIFKLASQQHRLVGFEAAVAGGIPIIKAIRESLAGNRIQSIVGIINGTCNFILSEMRDKGSSFSEVLIQAQQLGYAESCPDFDVKGIDAAHKLTILASVAFGIPLQFDKVYVEGITELDNRDIAYAEEFGYRVKHLGICKHLGNRVELRVHPALVPQSRLLANVGGVMNAVVVTGDAAGPTLYYGAGAGADPTASAVVGDLVEIVRTMTTDPESRVPHLAFQADALSDIPIATMDNIKTAYYLRLMATDKPGVLARLTRILADYDISIEAVLQKEPDAKNVLVPVALLTHEVQEKNIIQALAEIEALDDIPEKIIKIRLETIK